MEIKTLLTVLNSYEEEFGRFQVKSYIDSHTLKTRHFTAGFSGLVEMCGDGLARSVTGFGSTAEEAVHNLWDTLTEEGYYIRVSRDGTHQEFIWDGERFSMRSSSMRPPARVKPVPMRTR